MQREHYGSNRDTWCATIKPHQRYFRNGVTCSSATLWEPMLKDLCVLRHAYFCKAGILTSADLLCTSVRIWNDVRSHDLVDKAWLYIDR